MTPQGTEEVQGQAEGGPGVPPEEGGESLLFAIFTKGSGTGSLLNLVSQSRVKGGFPGWSDMVAP